MQNMLNIQNLQNKPTKPKPQNPKTPPVKYSDRCDSKYVVVLIYLNLELALSKQNLNNL